MVLASRGLRDMDTGPEAIADASEIAQVRRQARKVHTRALLVAAALVVVAVVLPVWGAR